MKYTWLFIALFFWMPTAMCRAEAKAGTIKDAEFVIEKQKNNRVNQEQRLFFKAPTPATKNFNKPLATVKGLMVEELSFGPEPHRYLPFNLEKKRDSFSFNHYCRLGIGSLLLPYLEVAFNSAPSRCAIWSATLAFVPELWNKKSTEASVCLQGRYGVGAWLLQPSLDYQHNWYQYSDTITSGCSLHQGRVGLLFKQASPSQNGQVNLNFLDYPNKKISEQLLTLKYKWVKQLDNCCLQVASYNDIAGYTNHKKQQTRFILSVAPSVYLRLLKSMQLKAGLRMAYHNNPVSGDIPNFALCPMAKINCMLATWFTPYIGIKGMGVGGSVMPLHLHDVVAKNPFIAPSWTLSHRYQYLKLYGGSRGVVSPDLSYHLHLAYRQLKNQSRMVVVTEDQIKLKYNPVRLNYNPNDCNQLKATGLIDYSLSGTTLKTTIQASYYWYFDNKSAPIWWYHKPGYKLKPILTYSPHPKFLLKSNLKLYGPTTVKDIDGNKTELGMIINLSLGMDYSISKRFTAFLMVSNLFNRKHITYAGYPDKKFNITGGLQYRW
ncbi:MAG: hypothetical protein NMK33_02800 [Candidatus Cardinium sp.]|uniref:hypothetical protein n=1 Tax=Cardinium endosymbiont of Dermatophagoides farinae TaxID=2597823 RepID=UPI001183833E|nr:hypothetical protein [Cardinium endosymbiont of Dermatophagoides farinae]TSJ81403.1 hypothetical protein FPG78_05485 [Cardinium endosymbiont of Dermatophagoides farinae]UWW97465.1 MAG: hypothetical protein NMK33_02800 [Candidatus Cardinium sp.]